MNFKTILLILLSPVFLLSAKCKKDDMNSPSVLPPITQEGKNTFGCKVNGEVWVPYYKCGGTGNPCGEIASDVYRTNVNSPLPLSLSIALGRRKNNSSTAFLFETPTNKGIFSVGNKIDSVTINYLSADGGLYYNYNYYNRPEIFQITKLDTINKIISGIFETTLYASVTDSVKITEGRFDLKFGVCKCSYSFI